MLKRRAYSDEAEFKYRTIRAGVSPFKFYMGKVLDQQLRTHLQREYRNESETTHTMKLTGMIEVLRKNVRFRATRNDMKRYFHMAEKMRWDKKYGLSREDAVANLFSRGLTKPKKIELGSRPADFKAKPTTPYFPRPGSSKGKIATKQIGAVKTLAKLEKLLRSLFSIGGN